MVPRQAWKTLTGFFFTLTPRYSCLGYQRILFTWLKILFKTFQKIKTKWINSLWDRSTFPYASRCNFSSSTHMYVPPLPRAKCLLSGTENILYKEVTCVGFHLDLRSWESEKWSVPLAERVEWEGACYYSSWKDLFWLQKIAWQRKAFFREYSGLALCSSDGRGEYFWSIFPRKWPLG